MKLSIIICVCNTDSSLLDECLASITSSTLQKGEYELIVIDDGSDKDYSEIIKKYRAVYARQPRRGTLSARLRGIDAALGEYITFVDSDDTVGFNYHLPMILRAEEGYDIVFNRWAFHSGRTRYYCTNDDTVSGNFPMGEPLDVYFARGGKQHSYYVLWNKVYRSRVLKEAAAQVRKLRVPDMFVFSEDALINLYAFKNARNISHVDTDFYFYRIHKGQTVTVTSRERLTKQIDCMSYTLDNCLRVLSETGRDTSGLDGWRALMSRGHYANAKAGGYEDLLPYIKKKYGVSTLRLPEREDGAVYEKVRILPESLIDIEKKLLALFRLGGVIRLRGVKKSSISALLLQGLSSVGSVIRYDRSYPALPDERVPIVKQMLFCRPIRALGARLFKKGSKARAFLKRFL